MKFIKFKEKMDEIASDLEEKGLLDSVEIVIPTEDYNFEERVDVSTASDIRWIYRGANKEADRVFLMPSDVLSKSTNKSGIQK